MQLRSIKIAVFICLTAFFAAIGSAAVETVASSEAANNSATVETPAAPSLPEPAVLKKIRPQIYSNTIRVAFDVSRSIEFYTRVSNGNLFLFLVNTRAADKLDSFIEIDDEFMPYLTVQKVGNDLAVGFPYKYKLNHKEFILDSPSRLVIDFNRDFTDIISTRETAPGIKLYNIVHGSQSGFAYIYAVEVNTLKAEVIPAPAPPNPSILERFVDIVNPLSGEPFFSFSRNTVSNIVKHYNALGGINGTFFSPQGYPYGIFMVNYELMSSPIYERTAMAITDDNKYYIDNFASNDFFYLPSGVKIQIKAINEPIQEDGVILYTRRWGPKTRTSKEQMDVVIKNDRVVNMVFGNAEIPIDGYVLSVSGSALEYLSNTLKIGDQISMSFNLIPFSISKIKSVKHLIGGGPRLVKSGQIYVSKHEEKFRRDVAKVRAARSAVGITADGKVFLVTVDGRKPKRIKKLRSTDVKSIGMTLEELSRLMIFLGAEDAMNLDGGSSSSLVLGGKVINSPVAGSEISVANALIIKALK